MFKFFLLINFIIFSQAQSTWVSPTIIYKVVGPNNTLSQLVSSIPRLSAWVTDGNLKMKLVINDTKTPHNIQVCGNRFFQPTSYPNLWDSSSCAVYAMTTEGAKAISIDSSKVKGGDYWFTISANISLSINATLEASYCEKYAVHNCEQIATRLVNQSYTVDKNETFFYSQFNTLKLQYVDVVVAPTKPKMLTSRTYKSTHMSQIYIQTENLPDPLIPGGFIANISYNNTMMSHRIMYPQRNTTFSAYVPTVGSAFDITFQSGPNCDSNSCPMGVGVNVSSVALMKVNYNATMRYTFHFSVPVPGFNSSMPFYFGVAPISSTMESPSVYLRFKEIATPQLYDLAGHPASGGNLLAAQSLEAGIWYVTITVPVNTTFAYWTGSLCPGNCSGVGVCRQSGSDFGVCDCSGTGYEGVGCADESGGFKTEYIVLIVIAAVIVVAGLLGVIVFVMNSKDQSVEQLG